jgi:glutathione synthase
LMRKDPPVNEDYIYTTYILEQAERAGTVVVNRPQSLRDANEKLFATYFSDFCPPTLVTQSIGDLYAFWRLHKEIVCKPLNSMGGTSVFCLRENDMNAAVIFETLTVNGSKHIMVQKYLPAIQEGDKRILLIDGKPLSHALLRIPQGQDWRGNLAVGAKGVAVPLSLRDQEICAALGPHLRERGLYFVGIDVIGDYLTEVNVTSPTCIRELDQALDSNISGQLMDKIETL